MATWFVPHRQVAEVVPVRTAVTRLWIYPRMEALLDLIVVWLVFTGVVFFATPGTVRQRGFVRSREKLVSYFFRHASPPFFLFPERTAE